MQLLDFTYLLYRLTFPLSSPRVHHNVMCVPILVTIGLVILIVPMPEIDYTKKHEMSQKTPFLGVSTDVPQCTKILHRGHARVVAMVIELVVMVEETDEELMMEDRSTHHMNRLDQLDQNYHLHLQGILTLAFFAAIAWHKTYSMIHLYHQI